MSKMNIPVISLKYPYRRVKCQYCEKVATIVNGVHLYGDSHKLSKNEFYYCDPCKAWVGMHQSNKKPLGTLAKADLRKKRLSAHAVFDSLWSSGRAEGVTKSAARKVAYAWLAKQLDLSKDECHIGCFDIEMCNKVISLCLSVDRQKLN